MVIFQDIKSFKKTFKIANAIVRGVVLLKYLISNLSNFRLTYKYEEHLTYK